jgi:hypothetical protein
MEIINNLTFDQYRLYNLLLEKTIGYDKTFFLWETAIDYHLGFNNTFKIIHELKNIDLIDFSILYLDDMNNRKQCWFSGHILKLLKYEKNIKIY